MLSGTEQQAVQGCNLGEKGNTGGECVTVLAFTQGTFSQWGRETMPKQSGSLTEQEDLSSVMLECLESVRQGEVGGQFLDCPSTGQVFMGPSRDHLLQGKWGYQRSHRAGSQWKSSPEYQNMESHTETQKVHTTGTYSNWKNKSKPDRIKGFCQ